MEATQETGRAIIERYDRLFIKSLWQGDRICSGGCPKGGDRFADLIARSTGIPILTFYAAWDTYGKSAGFRRNAFIARESDVLIACVVKARTGGTEDTIKKWKRYHPGLEPVLV